MKKIAVVFAPLFVFILCGMVYAAPDFLRKVEMPPAVSATYLKTGDSNAWYFTASELADAFRYQYTHGVRLPNPVKSDWGNGGMVYTAIIGGEKVNVPERFVDEVRRHITEMIERGAARYVFFGDAGHAHFVLPRGRFDVYAKLSSPAERLRFLVNEKRLGALYHTAETLGREQATSPDEREWIEKRNVIGWFDGSPVQILKPNTYGSQGEIPEGLWSFSGFDFSAHSRGELFLFNVKDGNSNQTVMFDISF
ncbi:MAG: hypothetical protein HY456_01525 [Parcubacteria group bacterium]|nr:hypothetical protein [Parcubacteria group bacterium]